MSIGCYSIIHFIDNCRMASVVEMGGGGGVKVPKKDGKLYIYIYHPHRLEHGEGRSPPP